ncbi:MAG TPA: choice-of-anchor tandem repeat GloVer-containing protein [Terriglobales bacterium]
MVNTTQLRPRAGRLRSPSRQTPNGLPRLLALASIVALTLVASAPAGSQTLTVLHNFAGPPNDGDYAFGGLAMDGAGNLYGTTLEGGKNDTCSGFTGCGTAFELDASSNETVLYNFSGPDGSEPIGSLTIDANGILYGTTEFGGYTRGCDCGTVFKIDGDGETVLHRFTGADGAVPSSGVIVGPSGGIYGTASEGGPTGNGVVFKVEAGKETVLYPFTGQADGAEPIGGLTADTRGNLYGTTAYGGNLDDCDGTGCGVVFELTGTQETVLHAFKNPPDGGTPVANLLMDANGDLYGTTRNGGEPYKTGTVFKVGPDDQEHVLHRFTVNQHTGSAPKGIYPITGLARDAQGNLYGTTEEGGSSGYGVAYEITTAGVEKVLHNFCTAGCQDGSHPNSLIIDGQGNLYGTTTGGGAYGFGTIFKISTVPVSDAP